MHCACQGHPSQCQNPACVKCHFSSCLKVNCRCESAVNKERDMDKSLSILPTIINVARPEFAIFSQGQAAHLNFRPC